MEAWLEEHFQHWLKSYVPEEERERIEAGIREYLSQHDEVIAWGWSWSDIRNVAEREGFIK
jgi:hypothetical protein